MTAGGGNITDKAPFKVRLNDVLSFVGWEIQNKYCKTHYYRAPFNFTHFALDADNAYITGADIHSK